MATKFMAGKRIIGNKSDRDGLTDFNDSLESSGDGSNSGITLADNFIKQSLGSHTGNNGGNYYRTGYRALGSTLSTNWVLRFRYKPTALNSNSGNRDGDAMGIFVMDGQYKDNVNDTQVDSRKAIGYAFRSQNGNSTWYYTAYQGTSTSTVSGVMHHSSHQNFSDQATVGEEYYVEIIKNGTTVTVTQRVGSHSASVTETETISSSLSGFTHINIVSFDGNGSTQPVVEAEIRDIELWDDTTSASGTATWSGIDNFTHQTGTTGTDSKLGTGAYSFDGSNDYVSFGSASDWKFLHDGTSNTVAFWVKRDGTQVASEPCVIDTQGASASYKGISFYWSNNSAGTLTYLVSDGSGSDTKSVACGDFPDGEWHHVALTYDGSNITSYKDGVQNAQTSLSGFSPSTADPSYTLHAGRNTRGSTYYKGDVDDIGIYNRALSATEIGKLVYSDSKWITTSQQYVNANDTSSGKIYLDPRRSANNYTGTWDLGTTLSETAWTCRFKLNITSVDNSGDTCRVFYGLSSHPATTGASSNSLSFVGFATYTNSSQSQYYRLSTRGNNLDVGEAQQKSLSAETVYVEIIRKSGTKYSVRWTTNSDYTGGTLVDDQDIGGNGGSGSQSSMALRYFWVGNINVSGNSDCHIQGTIEDIKIDDGATSFSSADYQFNASDVVPQLVSSLSNKANLKAYYSMDSATVFTTQSSGSDGRGIFNGQPRVRLGQEFLTGHELIGKEIRVVKFWLKKVGSPTGTAYCRVRDSSDNIKATIGTLDVSTLTTSYAKTAMVGSGSATIANTDKVTFEFSGGSTNTEVQMETSASDVVSNSVAYQYATSWASISPTDLKYEISEGCKNDLVKVYPKIEDEMLFSEDDTGNDYIWDSTTNTWTKIS